MSIRKWVATLAVACAVASPASADDLELSARKARLTLRQADAPRHRVDLQADFPLGAWADDFDPTTERVALSVGGVTVLELEADGDRTGLREKGAYRWVYRRPREPGAARVRLVLDVAFGRIKFRGRRLDLTTVAGAGTEDVSVRLELGAQSFETELDFDTRGARWRLRRPAPVVPPDGPPVTPPPTGALPRTVVDVGQTSGVTSQRTVVVRTGAEWTSLWREHKPGSAPPVVDFTRDMVVAVFLGDRPNSGYSASVDGVSADPAGLSVIYTEGSTTGSCVIAPVVTQPYAIVRVQRVEGPASFIARSALAICHGGP